MCVCVPSSVKQHLMSSFVCNHLAEEEAAGCFTLIVFLLSCDYYCCALFPRGAMGWSVIVAFPGNTHLHFYG